MVHIALKLRLTWGVAPQESVKYSAFLISNSGNCSVHLPYQGDYYVIFHSDHAIVQGASVTAVLETLSYDISQPFDSCSLTMFKKDCTINIPDWSINAFLVFSSNYEASLNIEREYIPDLRFSYTLEPRNSILSSLWPLWFLLGIIALVVGLFVILAICGLSCSLFSFLIVKICPCLLDEDEDTPVSGEASYSGYGTYNYEPLRTCFLTQRCTSPGMQNLKVHHPQILIAYHRLITQIYR